MCTLQTYCKHRNEKQSNRLLVGYINNESLIPMVERKQKPWLKVREKSRRK